MHYILVDVPVIWMGQGDVVGNAMSSIVESEWQAACFQEMLPAGGEARHMQNNCILLKMILPTL